MQKKQMRFSKDQSHYILTVLVGNGKLTVAQAEQALGTVKNRVKELESTLDYLQEVAKQSKGIRMMRKSLVGPRVSNAKESVRAGVKISSYKRVLSPKTLRSLKRNGRYLGYLRHARPQDFPRIRAMRAKKGVLAAIKFAKQLKKRRAPAETQKGTTAE